MAYPSGWGWRDGYEVDDSCHWAHGARTGTGVLRPATVMKKLLSAIVSLCWAAHAGAGVEDGIKAYQSGDYATALKEFAVAAEAEDAMGMHLLASLYYQGHGVEKDLQRAIALFEAAAAKGYHPSNTNLGIIYHMGTGVARDTEKALGYYMAAGKQGDPQATFNLGQIFRKGDGVEKDFKRAITYYSLAAQQGYLPAVSEYGLLFARGDGVEKDYVEAYGWIALAADAGDEIAKTNLAKLEERLGDRLDLAKARAREIAEEIARLRRAAVKPSTGA